jgi:predicted nucleic acid-binding protein
VILVDTNVLLDVATDDPVWAKWSLARLDQAAKHDMLAIDPVVYAELSVGYVRIEELDAVLSLIDIDIDPLPREALFLAGKVFQRYRRRGGGKTGVLPDFFIGAHAAVAGMALLTRDPRRYRSYFPGLKLICPDKE